MVQHNYCHNTTVVHSSTRRITTVLVSNSGMVVTLRGKLSYYSNGYSIKLSLLVLVKLSEGLRVLWLGRLSAMVSITNSSKQEGSLLRDYGDFRSTQARLNDGHRSTPPTIVGITEYCITGATYIALKHLMQKMPLRCSTKILFTWPLTMWF